MGRPGAEAPAYRRVVTTDAVRGLCGMCRRVDVPRLFALAEGDRLCLSPRTSGTFTLDGVPPHKHTVMMATGTGLAPYMSMLRTHLRCGSRRRFVVLHGACQSRDLGYRSELEDLSVRCPNFIYVPILSRPQEEPAPWRGRLSDVFLCANPVSVEDMAARLAADGFRERTRRSEGELHVERYW